MIENSNLLHALILCLNICLMVPPLLRGANVEGLVLDRSGAPVSYADVRLTVAGQSTAVAEAETEEHGRFHLDVDGSGPYTLEIAKAGFVTAVVRVRPGGTSNDRVSAVLRRYGVISGRVLRATGDPAEGVIVFAQRVGKPLHSLASLASGHFSKVGPETGTYRLFQLEPGSYMLGIVYGSSGGAPARGIMLYPRNDRPEPLNLSDGQEVRDINFTVGPARAFTVAGRIDQSQGRLFDLRLVPRDRPEIAIASATVEGEGLFRIANVPEGRYSLLVSGPVTARAARRSMLGNEPLFGRADVELSERDMESVSVTLDEARSASFLISGQGGAKPCADTMELRLSPVEDWGSVVDTVASVGANEHSISGLAPGRYTVSVADPAGSCVQLSDKEVDLTEAPAAEKRRVFPVPVVSAGSIRGSVSAASNVVAVSVELTMAAHEGVMWPVEVLTPGSASRFAFRALPPGQYGLTLRTVVVNSESGPKITETTKTVEIEPGQQAGVDLDAK